MKSNEQQFFYKLDIALNRILNAFALINLTTLIFAEKEYGNLLYYYTLATIATFVFYLFIHESHYKFSWQRIVLRMPDVAMLIFVFVTHIPFRVFSFYLVGRQLLTGIRNRSLDYNERHRSSLMEQMSANPPGFFMLSFLVVIVIGTMLLMLPSAAKSGLETPFIDALFTATSATCVTGLIVVDTGSYFSLFGQLTILALIQIGALGIMTISAFFFIIIGQKLKMRSESLIQNVVGEDNKFDMLSLIKHILFVTLGIEIIGAGILYLNFYPDLGKGLHTLYISIFHSISSFCNAGFSLFNDSLMRWYDNFWINFTVCFLIIVGGIGFPVLQDLLHILKRKQKFVHLNLHTKIVLLTTLLLLILGTVFFFFSEYNSTMKEFSLKNRLLASFFQSVTTRTAGFNTIDISSLSDSSVLTSMGLMFIGASPGSTGGGVKTTAFFILLATVIAMFRNRRHVTAFSRKISTVYIKRVVALITVSSALLIMMIYFLLNFEAAPFREVLFEAFSAFGTVGLSMGITPTLSHSGKVIIIMLMYLGRVGPLTLGFAISQRIKKTKFDYIDEKINIG